MAVRFSRYLMASIAALQLAACGKDAKKQAAAPAPAAALVDTPYMAATAGTAAQNGRFVVQVQWQNRLKAKHTAVAKLIFADPTRQHPLAVSDVHMVPQLETTGQASGLMGSLQISADPVHPGIYTAGMVLFPRRGRWDLRITAVAGGQSDMAHVSVWVR